MDGVVIYSTLYVALVALLAVVAILAITYLDKLGEKELRRVALKLGLTYSPNELAVDPALGSSLGSALVEHDEHWRARVVGGILTGKVNGSDVTILDYEYIRPQPLWRWELVSSDASGAVRQTVACFRLMDVLPDFKLKPGGVFDKVSSLFRQRGIKFNTSPEFSKSYLLCASDESAVRELFRWDVINFFEHNKGWWVEVGAGWLIVYRLRRELSPREIPGFFTDAKKIFLLFGHYCSEREGEQAKAEAMRQRLAIEERALGSEHPAVATSLISYAVLLRKMGHDAEAEKLQVRAQAIRAKHDQENPEG